MVGNGIAQANQNSISLVLKTLFNTLWPIYKVGNHPQVGPKKLDFFLFSGQVQGLPNKIKSGIKAKMQLPFDYNLFILVVEHANVHVLS